MNDDLDPNWFVRDLLEKYEDIPEAYKKLLLEGYKRVSNSEDKKEAIDKYWVNADKDYGSSSSISKEKPLDEDEVIYVD